MIVSNILETIGNTPVLHIPLRGGEVDLFIKLEMFNPTQSMKDRMALSMVNALPPVSGGDQLRIVESSSGNTASGLSMIAAVLGAEFTALMDGHASADKVNTVRAFGGSVRLVSGTTGELATDARDALARKMSDEPGLFWTEQHNNPANGAGYDGLADELLRDIGTGLTHLISAIGTGGSLCGTATALKAHIPRLHVTGVEPEGSIIFGGPGHPYCQSGTGTPAGAGVGLAVDYDVIDRGCKIGDAKAFSTCHYLARRHGLLVGGSTGGALYEALRQASDMPKGSKVVVLACDGGSKYLDTIYNEAWLQKQGITLLDIATIFMNVLPDRSQQPRSGQSAPGQPLH